jgi:predicted CXXCH cytochrome family protein
MTRRILIPILLLLSPVAARAAIEGGVHDLFSADYVVKEQVESRDRCRLCHLPLVGGDKYLVENVPSLAYYKLSGVGCYACHDGTTIVSPDVDATQSAFHRKSHPLSAASRMAQPGQAGRQELLPRRDSIECVTCHSPHDNNSRPFLRIPGQEICFACHEQPPATGYGIGNLSGNHPVHETVEDDAGRKSPITVTPEFRVPLADAYPIAAGKGDGTWHWRHGGHLSNGAIGLVECVTCHPVHGSEKRPPQDGLLTVPPVRETADLFCEGCHEGKRADEVSSDLHPNPGGTITPRTYHPCDDDRSNGEGRLIEIRGKLDWPMGSRGNPAPLLCTTCHVAHGGLPRSPALRIPRYAQTFCEECHLPEEMESHHPQGLSGGKSCEVTGGTVWGTGVSGRIYCSSCHVAHNAGLDEVEEEHVPILIASTKGDANCLVCHPEDNPTCDPKLDGTVSHFLGDPTLPSTYNDAAPKIRTDPWPETQLSSTYGGESGKVLLCRSCHSFRNPAVQVPHFLVARAGANVEWTTDLGVYLCTGCHGDNPGTGVSSDQSKAAHSHPLMNADSLKLPNPATPPATFTANGKINCHTCHRAHGAVPAGGYYIMNAVGGTNTEPKTIHPQIDFAVVCRLCHLDR